MFGKPDGKGLLEDLGVDGKRLKIGYEINRVVELI
jgi:hypothetical protein